MKKYLTLWPWLVALVCAVGFGWQQRQAGALGERLKELTGERDRLAKAAKVERLVFVHDTIRLTKTTTRYETLRDSVFATDTLLAHDTTFIRVVASADTAIKACRDVVSSCAANLRLADSLRLIDARLIKTLRAQRPSFVRRWSERLVVGSVGYTIRAVTAR